MGRQRDGIGPRALETWSAERDRRSPAERLRLLLWAAAHGDAEASEAVDAITAEFLPAPWRPTRVDAAARWTLIERLGRDLELWLGHALPFHAAADLPNMDAPRSVWLADLAGAGASTSSDEPPVDAPPSLWFDVRWVDEVGHPIDDVPISFNVDGEAVVQPTDADGRVRVDDRALSTAWVAPADEAGLREKLERRWANARDEPWIEIPDPGTAIQLRRAKPVGHARVSAKTLHTIVVQPRVVRARLFGAYFETNKCFLLPTAIPSLRFVAGIYERNAGCDLLLVGHTDTAGKPDYNDPLSVERADAMLTYLRNDVDAWYAWYGSSKQEKKRWNRREDILMIEALPDAATRSPDGDPIRWYQETRGLKVDGNAGPTTRKTLIAEYMHADGTTLPDGVAATTHGCGENFPVEPSADGEHTLENRRVEAYFFDGPVLPEPPGKNSKADAPEYREWVRRAQQTWDRWPDSRSVSAARCSTRYTLQRTFPKPSMIATLAAAARIMAERPYVQLVIAGHSDPPGSDDTNHRLSLARAEAVRAFLVGDAAFFRQRFEEPDPLTAWEWEEIQWMLHGVRVGGSPCYVGEADGFAGAVTLDALAVFQLAHEELAVTYWPDPDTMDRLIEAYLGLLGDVPRPEPERIDVVGGGSWHEPRPFGPRPDPEAQTELAYGADLRRIELFLFEEPPTPPVEDFPTTPGEGIAVYDAWCDAVGDEIAAGDGETWLQVLDDAGIAIARASVGIAPWTEDEAAFAGTTVSTFDDGCGSVIAPRGFYVATHGDDATSFRLDPDEACGVRLRLSDCVEPPPELTAYEQAEA